MSNNILFYATRSKRKHEIQGCAIDLCHFARTVIMLTAMALSACQSVSPTQSEPVIGNLSLNMLEMSYKPAKLHVAQPGRYLLKITNTSSIPHDIIFSNGVQLALGPGQQSSTVLDIPNSGLSYYCSLPGHKEAGMTGSVTVDHEAAAIPKQETTADSEGVKATPAYEPYDPVTPPLLPFKKHDIYLIAEEKINIIAKGVSQQLWTYNGKVPGPVIHVRVGDIVRVHLSNPSYNKLPHSVDFHSSQVAWNDEMTSINPGEEKTYEWRADYAGVWMYHCGSNPALHHIASGMYGMVIVEPREGLPKVDHEFALVQKRILYRSGRSYYRSA